MLMLLLGFLLGMILGNIMHTLVTHLVDVLLVIKTDLLLIKDKVLVLLHIKDKVATLSPDSVLSPNEIKQ